MDQVGLDQKVVVDELRRPRVVGEDAAHRGRRDEDRLGFLFRHPSFDVRLAAQIDHVPPYAQDLAILRFEAAHQGRSHHAPVTGDVDALAGKIVDRFGVSSHFGAPRS